MRMESHLEFLGIGINRASKCLSRPSRRFPSVVAFCAGKFVVLYDISRAIVLRTMAGHTSAVKTVFWLNPQQELAHETADEYLVSGDSSGNIRIWDPFSCECVHEFCPSTTARSVPTGSISSISGAQTSTECFIVATTSTSFMFAFTFRKNSQEWIQSYDFFLGARKTAECSSVAVLPRISDALINDSSSSTNEYLISLGSVDSKVHIFHATSSPQSKVCQINNLAQVEGHGGWIRCTDLFTCRDNQSQSGMQVKCFLASASQDSTVRISAISLLRSVADGESTPNCEISIRTEAILVGHEDWVTTVEWVNLNESSERDSMRNLRLLSTSMDHSMILWEPYENEKISCNESDRTPSKSAIVWNPSIRVGEIGYDGVGFFGGCLVFNKCLEETPDPLSAISLLGYTFTGQLYLWEYDTDLASYRSCITASGHSGPVMDVDFDPTEQCIISVSSDQTSRLFTTSTVRAHQTEEEYAFSRVSVKQRETWHEFSRPQIHGYDLSCVSFVPLVTSRHAFQFISGAEEKVLRVFEAPGSVLEFLENASSMDLPTSIAGQHRLLSGVTNKIQTAYKPELSLTNKAVEQQQREQEEDEMVVCSDSEALEKSSGPPLGDALSRTLLWPEAHKLYGHGDDVLALAHAHSKALFLTSCKARDPSTAAVLVWSSETWKVLGSLEGHKSSVVQVGFSMDDRWIATVSKDRSLCVYKQSNESQNTTTGYALHTKIPSAHKRIIWTFSFSPDSNWIATGSRDNNVKIWSIPQTDDDGNTDVVAHTVLPSFGCAITAMAFAPWSGDMLEVGVKYLVAIGFESGNVEIWGLDPYTNHYGLVHRIPQEDRHVAAVRRVKWRSHTHAREETSKSFKLITCSLDHSVRVHRVELR